VYGAGQHVCRDSCLRLSRYMRPCRQTITDKQELMFETDYGTTVITVADLFRGVHERHKEMVHVETITAAGGEPRPLSHCSLHGRMRREPSAAPTGADAHGGGGATAAAAPGSAARVSDAEPGSPMVTSPAYELLELSGDPTDAEPVYTPGDGLHGAGDGFDLERALDASLQFAPGAAAPAVEDDSMIPADRRGLYDELGLALGTNEAAAPANAAASAQNGRAEAPAALVASGAPSRCVASVSGTAPAALIASAAHDGADAPAYSVAPVAMSQEEAAIQALLSSLPAADRGLQASPEPALPTSPAQPTSPVYEPAGGEREASPPAAPRVPDAIPGLSPQTRRSVSLPPGLPTSGARGAASGRLDESARLPAPSPASATAPTPSPSELYTGFESFDDLLAHGAHLRENLARPR
jgi:hypothetical protein